MADQSTSFARFIPAHRYSRFSWAFLVLFVTAMAFSINFGNIHAAAIAAYLVRISSWKDVYLMSAIGVLLMAVLFAALAIAMGRWGQLEASITKEPLFYMRSGVFHYLGMTVSSALALYATVLTGRIK